MTEKIHTIQSSDKKEFDKQVNELLELGGELMDGGYQIIQNNDGVIYSQVILLNNFGKIEYDDNRNLISINRDGEENGISIIFSESGQIIWEGTFKNGSKNGWSCTWRENGSKHSEIIWKNDRIESHLVYYPNGQKKYIEKYKITRGLTIYKDGYWIKWYDNGRKEREKYYRDDKLDGDFNRWYSNGQKKLEERYILGKKNGNSIEWYSNGQKRSEGLYKDGKSESYTLWYDNGQKSDELIYENGNLISEKRWTKNGLLKKD